MRTLVAERPAGAAHRRRRSSRERIWPRVTTLAREPRALCSLTHSGQRKPTGAGIMHSWQIGRPQLEHETPVSRSVVTVAVADREVLAACFVSKSGGMSPPGNRYTSPMVSPVP